ncbi:hypothetical protein DV736_g6413, partial [Chaetothyriales sp. CBS 134916]
MTSRILPTSTLKLLISLQILDSLLAARRVMTARENTNSVMPLEGRASKRNKGGDGRPAMSRRVTADLDSDDDIIVRMKNAKYHEKDIAKRLADEGRMKVMQGRQDELLDANLTDWNEGNDDVLKVAIKKADEVVERAIQEAQDRKWRVVADNMKVMKPVTNFSKNACEKRFLALEAGTAKPTPESIPNPSPAVQARINARRERERKIEENKQKMSDTSKANMEGNAWISKPPWVVAVPGDFYAESRVIVLGPVASFLRMGLLVIAVSPSETYHALYFGSRFFCRSLPFLSARFICSKIHCADFNRMFSRSFKTRDGRVTKPVKSTKTMYPEHMKRKLQASMESPTVGSALTSPIVTLMVGTEQRLFAAHEDVLCRSPFFAAALKGKFLDDSAKKVNLPEEEPEILSCVLEFLYKGDYYPRLLHDKRRNTWDLEDAQDKNGGRGSSESTIYLSSVGGDVLRDTVVYCAAEKYGLDELKRLALRKQGLQSGIQVDVILRSARYAYDHTPDTESRLRAHYLALIIRSRKTFKRSGTMQMEMENGGKLFFDLFVAMCNHIDDIVEIR